MSISVEGNIGAGKSTFLKFLAKNIPHLELVPEPIDAWRDFDGQNLLQLFYEDPARWAYAFQMFAFYSRVKQVAAAESADSGRKSGVFRIHERCTYSDKHIFALNCHLSGLFQPAEWSLYRDQFDFLHEHFDPKIVGFIYIRTKPEIAHSRLRRRARAEESTVPLEYLEAIHQRHEDWLCATPPQPTATQNTPLQPSTNENTPLQPSTNEHTPPQPSTNQNTSLQPSTNEDAPFSSSVDGSPLTSQGPSANGSTEKPLVMYGRARAGDVYVPVLVLNGDVDYMQDEAAGRIFLSEVASLLRSSNTPSMPSPVQ